MENRNTLVAEIFVDELARSGLKHAVLAPGSRHTPLVLAFAEHLGITVHSQLDERSAAFFALGLARGTETPVALCCTSGSAAANFFPAIIEAHQSRVPLIVITADRPPELRHSGANQTIDQIRLFGDYALWFVDVALPEANPPAVALRNLCTTANRAYSTANGLRKGVVHINMPFRKPLEPTPVEGDRVSVPDDAKSRSDNQPFTAFRKGSFRTIAWREQHLVELGHLIDDNENGIIVCGPSTPTGARRREDVPPMLHGRLGTFAQILNDFTVNAGYPVFADSISGTRFGPHRSMPGLSVWLSGYETFLQRPPEGIQPDIIIRFGDMPTSKWLNDYLANATPQHHIVIRSDGVWADDSHTTTHFIQADEFEIAELEAEILTVGRLGDSEWKSRFLRIEQTTWDVIEREMESGPYFDGGVVYDVVDLIPDGSTLFVGNSLPVRHLDQFGKSRHKTIHAYASRGASGIDGNISTALGLGKARPDVPLVAIVGDITFYHDMNGLLAVHRCGVPVTIVLLNNDGGGIFHRLPIRDYEPPFTDLFVTPHGLDFSHAARMYGLDYVQIDGDAPTARDDFRAAFEAQVGSGASKIIEVRTDARADLKRRNAIVAAVQAALETGIT